MRRLDGKRQGLVLCVPECSELRFRQDMMADAETMSYNKGYAPFPGYDPATGCIAFPEDQWADWHRRWIDREPERFYAYLCRESDGIPVGEVNYHASGEEGVCEIGIVLHASFRGMGYSGPGLQLLCERAFLQPGIRVLQNVFESNRLSALQIHLQTGFVIEGEQNDLVTLRLNRCDVGVI